MGPFPHPRRCVPHVLATVAKQWPEATIVGVTSPLIPMRAYPTPEIPLSMAVEAMVGDVQKIREYPARGFQIPMEMPADAWAAFVLLARAGFDAFLLPGTSFGPDGTYMYTDPRQ